MFHSIIIPHRNFNRFLAWCLWSIRESERRTGISDYEILVVDSGSAIEPEPPDRGAVLHCQPPHPRLFNKSRLLNIGIALSRGDVLTFLDADAIVGPRWLEGVRCLEDPHLTRLCYRVRYLPLDEFAWLEECPDTARLIVNGFFVNYTAYPVSGEIYGSPDEIYQGPAPPPPYGPHVFGTSQASIRRETLGSIRHNMQFAGRGFEDQWLIREIWRREGEHYSAAILTELDFAMFHVRNPEPMRNGEPWNDPKAFARNKALYEST